jgi:hypothetical protein
VECPAGFAVLSISPDILRGQEAGHARNAAAFDRQTSATWHAEGGTALSLRTPHRAMPDLVLDEMRNLPFSIRSLKDTP